MVDDGNWGTVNMYLYIKGGNAHTAWPGEKLEFDRNITINGKTGVYHYVVDEEFGNGRVIFSKEGGADQYPGQNQDGLEIDEKDKVFYTSNNKWEIAGKVEYPWSATLPLIRIKTYGQSIGYGDAGAAKGASFNLDPLGLEGVTAITNDQIVSLTIKGRSKSYWNTDIEKKPYKLKFKEKASVLGMPTSKHWVLMPYTKDTAYGLLSNFAGHEISRLIGLEWTSSMKPVEVVINDEYMGLYFIAENVRAAAERVQIADYGDPGYSEADDFLLEFSREHNMTDEVEKEIYYSWTTDGFENKLATATPAREDIYDKKTEAEGEEIAGRIREHLEGHVNALTDAVAKAKALPLTLDWTSTIDHEQAAKYYVVQEIMDDNSAFADNFYMHHTTGSRWIMGPVWDFDNAFASNGEKRSLIHERDDYEGTFIKELYTNRHFVWFTGFTFVQFVTGENPRGNGIMTFANGSSLQESYNPAMSGTLNDVLAAIDNMAGSIEDAVDKDAVRWPAYAATEQGNSFTNRVNKLKANLEQNVRYLSTSTSDGGAGWNWNEITTGVDDITAGEESAEAEYFDVMGRRVANPQPGSIYIVRRGANVTKEIMK